MRVACRSFLTRYTRAPPFPFQLFISFGGWWCHMSKRLLFEPPLLLLLLLLATATLINSRAPSEKRLLAAMNPAPPAEILYSRQRLDADVTGVDGGDARFAAAASPAAASLPRLNPCNCTASFTTWALEFIRRGGEDQSSNGRDARASTARLQLSLLKVALLVGVRILVGPQHGISSLRL